MHYAKDIYLVTGLIGISIENLEYHSKKPWLCAQSTNSDRNESTKAQEGGELCCKIFAIFWKTGLGPVRTRDGREAGTGRVEPYPYPYLFFKIVPIPIPIPIGSKNSYSNHTHRVLRVLRILFGYKIY